MSVLDELRAFVPDWATVVDRWARHAGVFPIVRPTDGCRAYFKIGAPAQQYAAEAEGLNWIAETGAIRVPQIYGRGVAHGWILLEDVGAPPESDHGGSWEDLRGARGLGRGLALLHQARGSKRYGATMTTFVGPTPQNNEWRDDWAEFFLQQRLVPIVEATCRTHEWARRGWPESRISRFLQSAAYLLEGIPAGEGPSLVHGDLWTGNVVYDVEQRPSLIDPGAYWGHREVDLAMLGLFGNPGPEFQEGYDTVFPRVAGWQERVPVYNSYHAWNHGLLFGEGYAPMIEAHARAVIEAT